MFSQSIAEDPGSSSHAEATQLATAMVKANDAWGEKLNSNGAVLTLKETAREGSGISYRLYGKGLPTEHVYALIQWPVTQKEPSGVLTGVTFDKSGLAVCAGKLGTCGDPAKPDDPIDLRTSPVKGEPLRFAIVAQDDAQIRAAVKAVPVPNAGEDNGCRLDAVLLMPHAELLWLEATKVPSHSELTIIQDSEGEIQKTKAQTDVAGRYAWAIMPAKAGLKTGTVKIRVQAPGCNPQVSVRWGITAQ
jgi:hypothetical protein